MDPLIFGWGVNSNDQLTGQTGNPVPSPFSITGFTGTPFQVSAGSNFSLAALTNNSIWGWGANSSNQINSSGSTTIANPTQIVGFTGTTGTLIEISAGEDHSLALFSDNSLWGWGVNGQHQINSTGLNPIKPPVQISGITGTIQTISAGYLYSLVATTDNNIWGWGENFSNQILGSTGGIVLTPTIIPGFPSGGSSVPVVKLLAGDNFSLALFNNNTVWGWGVNGVNQILGSTTSNILTPTSIPGLTGNTGNIIDIASGGDFSFALFDNNTVYGWGLNTNRQISGSTTDNVLKSPFNIPGFSGITGKITNLTAGSLSSFALVNNNQVYGWGQNGSTADQISGSTGVLVSSPYLIPGFPGSVFGSTGSISANSLGSFTLSLMNFSNPSGIPCFVKDTPVLTDSGVKLIQDISNEDYIDSKRVFSVVSSPVYDDECTLVLIKKNALGRDIPTKDTVCTQFHNILINDVWIEAKYLVDNISVEYIIVPQGTQVYHILLDDNKWGVMNVNNMFADTLCPDNLVAKEEYSKGNNSSSIKKYKQEIYSI